MSPYLCESSQEMFLNYFVASANDITGNAQYHITINKRYFARLSAVCNFKNPFFFIYNVSIAFLHSLHSSMRSQRNTFSQMLNIHLSCCSYKCFVVKSWQTLLEKRKK